MQSGLTSNQIKLIAIIAMTIDHLTWTIFPGCQTVWYVYLLHIVGRLTAPIMWFFIAEGAHYTHNLKRYALRLFLFAGISHFAYSFAFGHSAWNPAEGVFNRTSVLWSLAIAVILIGICRKENISGWIKILAVAVGCILAFPSDWSSIAVMAPLYLYANRGNFRKQAVTIVFWTFIYATVYFVFLNKPYAILQMFTFLTIPVLARYNGERGTWKGMKWFFYLYYPAHLFVLGFVRLWLHGDIITIF